MKSDLPTPEVARDLLDIGISALVRKLCNDFTETPYTLSFNAGLNKSDLYQPLEGRRHWSLTHIVKVARYFNLSVAEFLTQAEATSAYAHARAQYNKEGTINGSPYTSVPIYHRSPRG